MRFFRRKQRKETKSPEEPIHLHGLRVGPTNEPDTPIDHERNSRMFPPYSDQMGEHAWIAWLKADEARYRGEIKIDKWWEAAMTFHNACHAATTASWAGRGEKVEEFRAKGMSVLKVQHSHEENLRRGETTNVSLSEADAYKRGLGILDEHCKAKNYLAIAFQWDGKSKPVIGEIVESANPTKDRNYDLIMPPTYEYPWHWWGNAKEAEEYRKRWAEQYRKTQ